MALTLTATAEPDEGRIRLDITGQTGTTVIATKDDRGRPRQVRGADPLPTGQSVAYDYEALFGAPTRYTATDSVGTAEASATLDADRPWWVHPFLPFLSQPIRVMREDDSVVEGRGTEFDVIGRASPIALTQPIHTRSGAFRLVTRVGAEREALRDLIADGSILLLRSPCVAVDDARWMLVRRITESHANDTERYWDVEYRVVDRPTGSIQYDPEWTWQSVLDSSATWGEVVAGWPTWRDLVLEVPAVGGGLFGW